MLLGFGKYVSRCGVQVGCYRIGHHGEGTGHRSWPDQQQDLFKWLVTLKSVSCWLAELPRGELHQPQRPSLGEVGNPKYTSGLATEGVLCSAIRLGVQVLSTNELVAK